MSLRDVGLLRQAPGGEIKLHRDAGLAYSDGVFRLHVPIVSNPDVEFVVAGQRVEIAGTARVTGSLSGHSIAVAEGAIIEGEIRVMSGDTPVKFQEKRHGP